MAASDQAKPKKKKKKSPPPPVVTVENLTNSLAQIELWVNAVRLALSGLNPEMELPMRRDQAKRWFGTSVAPLRVGKDCPPPE